MTNSVLSYC